jgi:hypothetical protein
MLKKYFTFDLLFRDMFFLVLGFIVPLLLQLLGRIIGIKEAIINMVIFSISIVLFYYSQLLRRYEPQIARIIQGILLFLILYVLLQLLNTYKEIPEWDFLCFYLFGKVGISTSDFYNPVVFSQFFYDLQLQSSVSDDFIKEIVNVGFWYPPISIFLFLPLGIFNLQTGFIIWQTLIIIVFVINIIIIIKYYSILTKDRHLDERHIYFALIVLLLFPKLTISMYTSQIYILFLLFLILLIINLKNWKSGIYLPILIVIKPLAAIFILYFIFWRKWKALIAASFVGIILTGITVIFYGYQPFIDYVISPPTSRLPDFVYFEGRTLFGLLKKTGRAFPNYFNTEHIKFYYYIISIILVFSTIYIQRKLRHKNTVLTFMAFIPLALIVYPLSNFQYLIIDIPVIIYFLYKKPFKNDLWNFTSLFILYLIGNLNVLIFNLVLWGIFVSWPMLFKNKLVFRKHIN